MKVLYSIGLFMVLMPPAIAQLKPPVAEDDFVRTYYLSSTKIDALANDHSYPGHKLVLQGITDIHLGFAYINSDSVIKYLPPSNNGMHLADTIHYIIKDVNTNLLSEEATIIVSLDRIRGENLDINNINGRINAVGNHFRTLNYWDPFGSAEGMEAPKGSSRMTIYNSALWIGGYDKEGVLHTACERYRTGKHYFASSSGFDFWPGPLSDSYFGLDYMNEYNRVYKVSRDEIELHQQYYDEPGYVMPDAIRNWPAHGDVSVGQSEFMAPFMDSDGDGFYNPNKGDYPLIKGDQSVVFIFNDEYDEHTESFGEPLGVDVLGQAWAYDCPQDSAFYHAIFVRYDIINRKNRFYHKLYIGNYTNFVLGFPDDYLGCDTVLNMYYAYNMDSYDDTTSHYNPGYGEHPPAQAVVFLNQNLDHFMTSAFPITFPPTPDTAYYNDPVTPEAYYQYLISKWRDNSHLTFGGAGHGGITEANHIFSGDPVTGSGWLFGDSGYESGVMHAIGSNGPYHFTGGDTLTLVLAYVFARDYQGDQLASLAKLKEYVSEIRWYYDNDSTPCGLPWSEVEELSLSRQRVTINPNPVTDHLKVRVDNNSGAITYSVFDLSGRKLLQGFLPSGQRIDCRNLKPGLYILNVNSAGIFFNIKFVKQ